MGVRLGPMRRTISDTGAHDSFHGADGGNAAALVIMRADAPDPSIFKFCAQRIHRPAAHLRARIHMPIDQQGRTSACPRQPPNRLPALPRTIMRMNDVHHLDMKAHVGQRVGIEVGKLPFLESRACDSD